MPESRDRLVRYIDVDAAFVGRRSAILGAPSDAAEHPYWQRTQVDTTGRDADWSTGEIGTSAYRTTGTDVSRGRNFSGSPLDGKENTPMTHSDGRGRAVRRPTNSVLPSWYPRGPLADITPIFKALQRKRAHTGEVEGHEVGTPRHIDPSLLQSGHPFERRASIATPSPSVMKKRCPLSVGKVPRILFLVANKLCANDSSVFLTPQKRLLDHIDTVEEEVMEELRKLKRTPSARKAQREKRIRTLLSVR
ncbi:hypothetical protein SAY86_014766 [Trapa natans]|uniref:Uncharacterized protein n=1 Tax=Trapa natans TaxID=22666 RepID=A0AAN7QJP1_TRANT|nr:hypothetical protein SAY86_014766 [Trapa natans]